MRVKDFNIFISNLNSLCKRRNISIRKVCKETGVPRSRLYSRPDKNNLDMLDVKKIAKYLDTTPRYMLIDHTKTSTVKRMDDVLSDVAMVFGQDAKRLLLYYIQLPCGVKQSILSTVVLSANSQYGMAGKRVNKEGSQTSD